MKNLLAALAGVFLMLPARATQAQAAPATDANSQTRLHSPGIGAPLYVLDGLPIPLSLSDSLMRRIDPGDILNITVVKDKTAAAHYGPAGGNGVVEMTTSLPFVVRGKLLTLAAEKSAVLAGIPPTQVRAIRQLTLKQTKRYSRRAERAAVEVLLAE
ncbi:MAG TPA: hypothetical protein VF598_11400 [Hymenobacter sp.]|jgi:hypothetical protein